MQFRDLANKVGRSWKTKQASRVLSAVAELLVTTVNMNSLNIDTVRKWLKKEMGCKIWPVVCQLLLHWVNDVAVVVLSDLIIEVGLLVSCLIFVALLGITGARGSGSMNCLNLRTLAPEICSDVKPHATARTRPSHSMCHVISTRSITRSEPR